MINSDLETTHRRLKVAQETLEELEVQAAAIPETERSADFARKLTKQRETVKQLQITLEQLQGQAEEAPPRGEVPDTGEAAPDAEEQPVHFVNRRYELELLDKPAGPKYVLLDAPAGYGKTFLLREVARRYRNRPDSQCILLDFEENPVYREDPSELVRAMLRQIAPELATQTRNLPDLINALAGNLALPQKRIGILLFDSVELLQADPRGYIRSWLWNDLTRSLEARLEARNIGLRAVFAGRYITGEWKGARRYLLHTCLLSPFDERVVLHAIQELAKEKGGDYLAPDRALAIAREVVDITGGHPKCIMQVLQEIAEYNFAINLDSASSDYFFAESQRERILREYVEPAIEQILRGIDITTREALSTISVFRRFNAETIGVLVRHNHIQWDGEPLHLLANLTRTHLVHPPTADEPFYADRVARLMLASRLKILARERYRTLNQLALDIYDHWARGSDLEGKSLPNKPTDLLQVVFVTEGLYHLAELLFLDQCGCEQASKRLAKRLLDKFTVLDSTFGAGSIAGVAMQLADAIGRDEELRNRVVQVAGDSGYDGLLAVLDDFIVTLST